MRTGMASGDEFGSPHIRVRLPVARLATSVSGCCLYMWPAAPSVTRRVRGSSVGAGRFIGFYPSSLWQVAPTVQATPSMQGEHGTCARTNCHDRRKSEGSFFVAPASVCVAVAGRVRAARTSCPSGLWNRGCMQFG